MAEPTRPIAFLSTVPAWMRSGRWGAPPLWFVVEAAALSRIVAADAVQWYVQRRGMPRVCLFPDAEYYWSLARTIRAGNPYEIVEWGDIPHFALRTPGYPAFLAVCQALFGEHPLGARLVQAVLGALTVWLVYHLTRQVVGNGQSGRESSASTDENRREWSAPLLAALLTALHPYLILMSVLLLSEAVFVPLMVVALWGLAALWKGPGEEVPPGSGLRSSLIALGVGLASGAAILVRPSWALFVPVMLGAWGLAAGLSRGRSRLLPMARGVGLVLLGVVVIMAPWWVRNARIYGRFIPTAVWMGASLYDGLNPAATGASNMAFLSEPDIWPLGELDQDAELRRRALEFARANPGRAFELAVIKLGRYWSPWPNAEGFRSTVLAAASAAVVVPLLALLAVGLWDRRRDGRAWVLLAGPVLYFCALHMIFASSMRYRIPAEAPALGLAAVGMIKAARWRNSRGRT